MILGKTDLSTLIHPKNTAPTILPTWQFVCDVFVDSSLDIPDFMKRWDRENLEEKMCKSYLELMNEDQNNYFCTAVSISSYCL